MLSQTQEGNRAMPVRCTWMLAAVAALVGALATAEVFGAEAASPQVQRVFSLLQRERTSGDSTYFTDSYLTTLAPPQQLEVARRLSADESTAYASYGALLLVRLRHNEEAVAPTARLLLSGNDVSRLFWSWRNYDDPCLTDAMTLRLGTYLLRQYPTLHRAQRRLAETYLSGLGQPAGPFSLEGTRASLDAIEERLDLRGCVRPTTSTPR